MKDSVKITVIAAGFKDANKKNIHQKQSFLPKTWKAGREIPDEPVQQALPNVVHQVQQRGSGFVLTNPKLKKETRKAELKKADSVSPTRQVSATAEAFRWTRNEKFFDNRKAGKSTPTIVT